MKYNTIIEYLLERGNTELRPITCDECRMDGCSVGACQRCMSNQIYNDNWVETHNFIVDTMITGYHDGNTYHNLLKATPLREEDEHPRLYYGLELEVTFDDYGDYDDIACEFARITNGIAVFEHDSSVDNGFEIIFRPISKRRAYREFGEGGAVRKGLKYLIEQGAEIHQPSTNGLHIHVSKKFFRSKGDLSKSEVELNWLFQIFQPQLEQLCGREYYTYCQGDKENTEAQLRNSLSSYISFTGAKLKKGKGLNFDDHHTAINERNDTIEARIFKSTLNANTILAYIELMSNFAYMARDGEPEGKTLDEILHTKENLYLDNHILKCRRREFKKDKKSIDFKAENKSEIELEVA